MMKIEGIYASPGAAVLDGLRLSGTPEEFEKIVPLPSRDRNVWYGVRTAFQGAPNGPLLPVDPQPPYSMDIPANKNLVREISIRVHVDISDPYIIDWIAQP